jgi:multidrug efflux pump subunit AcrA (membrane-fusion protein)
MFVNVELVVEVRENAMAIPETAVVRRNNQRVAFVLSEDEEPIAQSVPVSTGLAANGWIEIVSGLSPTDRVVVEGNAFLEDQQPVRLVEGS